MPEALRAEETPENTPAKARGGDRGGDLEVRRRGGEQGDVTILDKDKPDSDPSEGLSPPVELPPEPRSCSNGNRCGSREET